MQEVSGSIPLGSTNFFGNHVFHDFVTDGLRPAIGMNACMRVP